MVSVNEFAPWAGVGVMLLVSYWSHRRDRTKEEAEDEHERDAAMGARIDKLQSTIDKHLIECAKASGQKTEAIKNLAASTDELKRSVNQLQAQMRNIATLSNDALIVRHKGSGG
jgi:molecular chaperone GrpE (heat shock protein)